MNVLPELVGQHTNADSLRSTRSSNLTCHSSGLNLTLESIFEFRVLFNLSPLYFNCK